MYFVLNLGVFGSLFVLFFVRERFFVLVFGCYCLFYYLCRWVDGVGSRGGLDDWARIWLGCLVVFLVNG